MLRKHACNICHMVGHNRATCPRRAKRPPRHCRLCAGLAHRRQTVRVLDDGTVREDRSRTHCLACAKPFTPEARMTIAEAMRLPANDRRVEPPI